jgi:hypothetical protein
MSEENKQSTDSEKHDTVHQHLIPLLPEEPMDDIIANVQNSYKDYVDIADSFLTDSQRKRKVGAGNKNYGFIDKASDLAETNKEYAKFFRIADLKNCIRNVETCRSLAEMLTGFWRAVTNTMLIYSDDAYSMALLFYNNVKEMAKRGDPMAKALADTLKTYFKRKPSDSKEPTHKELLRDIKALERGTKDGRIVIENISPKVTGGVRKVVDDVHKGKSSFKETDEGGVRE